MSDVPSSSHPGPQHRRPLRTDVGRQPAAAAPAARVGLLGWVAAQLDGVAWRPAAVAAGLATVALTAQTVAAVACAGAVRGCAVAVLEGTAGVGAVVMPVGLLVSLIMTAMRPGWARVRRRGLVRVARGVVGIAGLAAAGVAGIVGLLLGCSDGFLCGDDPAAAIGMFVLAGALAGLAVWAITARGRWWWYPAAGAALAMLPAAGSAAP